MKRAFVTVGIFLPLFFVSPFSVDASVVISEIAWMGSEENANAEWIELYNDGTTVDLSGWTLEATDGQPAIELSGTLGEGAYALLERTSDDSVPTVGAYLVYTGSLNNSGEVLQLRNSTGVVIDSVDGSDGWSIGGDNESKETLQRTGDPPLGGWTTGSPSPDGTPYVDSPQESTENTEQVSIQNTISQGNIIFGETKEEEKREKLQPALQLEVGANRTVIVGVPARFLAHAYSEGGREIESVILDWNFGDGKTARGKEVEHVFLYEGDYVVSVAGQRKNFIQEVKDEEKIIVHVIASPVHITEVSADYITLKNNDSEMLELSDCVLVSGSKHFKIPKDTYILGNATIALPRSTTGITSPKNVTLFNEKGIALSEKRQSTPERNIGNVASANTVTQTIQQNEDVAVATFDQDSISYKDGGQLGENSNELLALAYADNGSKNTENETGHLWWWILGLITAIVTAIIAILLVRQEQEEVIEGFYIESKK